MGSRNKPNHGGSGSSHSRKGRPKPAPPKDVKYGKIETLDELNLYLSGAKIACLLCGTEHRSLGHHLSRSHSMSSRAYKEMFNIPVTRSLICSDLKEMKREITKKIWRENPKMEAVRLSLKENIANLDGTSYRTKSTIPAQIDKINAGKMKDAQNEQVRIKYRAIYLEKIAEAIKADSTLYSVYKKTFQVYEFARRNNSDIEFIKELERVKRPDALGRGKAHIELICGDCGEKYITRIKKQAKKCGCKRRANAKRNKES